MSSPETGRLAELARLLERVRRAADQTEKADLEAAAGAGRCRSELDLLGDDLRAHPARSRELRTSVQLLREALERAKLSALNAGLEGARIGDPLGKALVDLSQDLRDQLIRAIATLEEHGAMLTELERERERVAESIEAARTALAGSNEALSRALPLKRELDKALGEIESSVMRELGSDPETTRLLTAAADQSRALLETLRGLAARGAEARVRELLLGLEGAVPARDEGDAAP